MESSYTDKCYIYFDKTIPLTITTVDDIVREAEIGTTLYNGECGLDDCSGLFYVSDGMYGNMTYYYRGRINNNWVKFGKENGNDIYWRIIRFNGDKSIRMIYSGTIAPTEETQYYISGNSTVLTAMQYNELKDDAVYSGWYYKANTSHANASTVGATMSDIASYLLDSNTGWYYTSGLSSYSDYIDENGKYCNDRTIPGELTASNGRFYGGITGYGTSRTAFAPTQRTEGPTIEASLSCYVDDLFLQPIGLITSDEAVLAGLVRNNSYCYNPTYLFSEKKYWTMSASVFDYSMAYEIYIYCNMSENNVGNSNYVRPVINLKSGTTFKAGTDGTWAHPYEVVES